MISKINVLVIDDSALVRNTLKDILLEDSRVDRVEMAADPYQAADRLKKFIPHVITLDIEMPKMDGLTFLKRLMSQHPIPVVICSSLTEKGADVTFKAFEYGAVEVIQKPKLGTKRFFEESKVRICDTVKAAAMTRVKRIDLKKSIETRKVGPKLTADAILSRPKNYENFSTTEKVIVVGASTGGTEALLTFLRSFPRDCPGIVIVQHMPEKFTAAFSRRLNNICEITVKEAQDNDPVLRGQALIAPGNFHMLLKRSGAKYYVQIKNGPLVSRHRPSVDVLFRSAARYAGKNAVGVIMTGMGDDGAKGMLEMKEAGAYNLAQDEKSCVVFGMPKEAIEIKAVNDVLPLTKLSQAAFDQAK